MHNEAERIKKVELEKEQIAALKRQTEAAELEKQELAKKNRFTSSRLTKVVCINTLSKTMFEWPSVQNQTKCMADGVYLRGVMNNYEKGTSDCFNFVMSNGDTSN